MATHDGSSDSTLSKAVPSARGKSRLPPPAWLHYLPHAMGGSAAVCLVGGAWVGARLSLRRAAEDPENLKKRAITPLPNSLSGALRSAGPPLATLAARAFLYGTLLCLGGAGVAVAAAAYALDVRSPQEFTDRLMSHGPRVRSSMEGAARPALEVVALGGRAAARATNETVGAAVRKTTPPLRSNNRDDDMEGLSARDAAAYRDFLAWVAGEGGEGVASAEIPHHVPKGLRRGVRVE